MQILVPQEVHADLAAAAHTLVPEADLRAYREDGEWPDGLGDAEAVLRWFSGKRYSDLVRQGPRVRWLHTASAGVDHILPGVQGKTGLTVTDSGPAFGIAISELVLAWMLMAARRLPEQMARQTEGKWEPVAQQELSGQTVGIVGMGPIGRAIATRAKAFGMRTLGLRRHPAPVEGVEEVLTGPDALERLLRESDFVVLAAALTDETRALIGREQIAGMKPTAWLINIARGGMVDEPALITALQRGGIAGAGLDVFAREPLPLDSPLWTMPNVFLSPHNSPGQTAGLRARVQALFLENLRRFVGGEPLENVVEIARGY